VTGGAAALAAAAGGALMVAGLIGMWVGLRPVPAGPPAPRRRHRRPQLGSGARLWLLVGVAVGAVGALLTGWLVLLVAAPAVVVSLPALLGAPDSARRVARVEAMEEWTRSLSGVLTAGMGLEQALVTSLRSTPQPIRGEVSRLVARLNGRMPTEAALRAFADDLDDATGDLLVASLILAARPRLRGAAGLASVLDSLAESVAADVHARREIEADRRKPWASARLVTLITLAVLVWLVLTGSYVDTYSTPLGQLVLGVLLAAYAACLLWMRRMSALPPVPRILGRVAGSRTAHHASPAAATTVHAAAPAGGSS
jgi:Flp pilus assembly protein TadB